MFSDFLCQRLKTGNVILFLGAGASKGCKNVASQDPPMSQELAEMLAEAIQVKFDAEKDSLKSLTSLAEQRLGTKEYHEFLRKSYQHCKPSPEYKHLTAFHWPRIYTTNVDDGLDNAFSRESPQHLQIINRTFPITERRNDINQIQIIKLNGSVDRLHEGLVFSVNEYTKEGLRVGTWYEQLASDYTSYTFVFIGTKLDEPLFYHHVERLASIVSGKPGEAYIVCPSFTDIQKEDLRSRNIIPIEGTLKDYVKFLTSCLGSKYTSSDVLANNAPAYLRIFSDLDDQTKEIVRGQANSFTVVYRDFLTSREQTQQIRDFYYGCEPRWSDIVDFVPAKLDFHDRIMRDIESDSPLVVIHGSAGCGKTTALMAACYELGSRLEDKSVFYINDKEDFPQKTIEILCSVTDTNPIFFVDDFEWCHASIKQLIENNIDKNVKFVVTERSIAWSRLLNSFRDLRKKVIKVEQISKHDIPRLLDKIQKFGPWARLGKLKKRDRYLEFEERADRQLLVALREATEGRRFDEILEDEYQRIEGDYERLAFHIAGLATIHRLRVGHDTFDGAMRRAVGDIQFPRDSGLEGILIDHGDSVSLRHSVIADYLIRKVADRNEIFNAIQAMLDAFTRFDSPLRWYAKNRDYQVYSSLINKNFLLALFKHNKELGLLIYRSHEKSFEKDGLFWLQFALYEFALGKDHRDQALNHIRLALATFPSSFQIIHAYANVHFSLAASAKTPTEARALVEDATEILEAQIAERPNDTYPLVAMARGRVKVFRRWFKDELRSEVNVLTERLEEAQKRFPSDRQISRILNETILKSIVTKR